MNDSPATRNIKLVIAYDGRAYHGWQRQEEGIDTVQERVEKALVRVVRHPVAVLGAGRTDAGVHAEGQVANFRSTNLSIPLKRLIRVRFFKAPRSTAFWGKGSCTLNI